MSTRARRFVNPDQLSLLNLIPADPLDMLASYWRDANERYFGGKLQPVPIVGGHAKSGRLLGTYGLDSKTFRPRIMVHESLLRRLDEPGLYLQTTDVVLHEMIHQFLDERRARQRDPRVREPGHGPRFTGECNWIGARLGVAEVAERKPRGKEANLSRHWPHCVRPERAYWLDNPRRVHWNRHDGEPLPRATVLVTRISRFGNPFLVAEHGLDGAIRRHREWLDGDGPDEISHLNGFMTFSRKRVLDSIPLLGGMDLACNCPAGQPCHGDELLRRAG
jgi:hypothetical protein